jgi:branched-chain amino acid transport system ATP-binding protein
MEKGEIRFQGPTAELLERPDILRSVFLEGAASVGDPDSDAARDPERTPVRVREPADDGRSAILEVRGMARSFGGIVAVGGVDLDAYPGEILGLIGPNGAGKTTLFDLVCGFTEPDAGSATLEGRRLDGRSPSTRSRRGLGRSFQDARLFPALTVEETLAVALDRWTGAHDPVSAALRLPHIVASEKRVASRVAELLEMMGLGAFRTKFVNELSTGTRRIVDLACVVAHRPVVVLLDEPSSGIAQREAEALAPVIRRIRDEMGCALVVIEHDMALLRSIADRMVALDQGAVVAEGTPEEVLGHPSVVASYLGSDPEALMRSKPTTV